MPIVKRAVHNGTLGHLWFVPNGYEENKDTTWPLILFLHGIKRRGEDLSMLEGYGLTGLAVRQDDFPFAVVAPQCPSNSFWPQERSKVIALLDHTVSSLRIDSARVYVTGFSMGGNGAWDLAAHAPDRFAAVVPLSGWYDPKEAKVFERMPVWAFHGVEDDVVPYKHSEEMVNAIKEKGGRSLLTPLPGYKHQIMDEVYRRPDLFEWLLSHRIGTN
ncbi:prolyl oligopeptidase family serine peptidase [Paenibacillus sp. MBLB4367]|uniref:carboxylesterase family protein n=1 Tax=Paenibacillus sp. MBLB4367 TaxID=3384767 RepID=UPI00390803B6